MRSDFKVRIFQPGITEYRVALYEGLASMFPGRIEVFAGPVVSTGNSFPLMRMPFNYKCPVCRIGPFFWQRGLSTKGLNHGDVIVVCGDLHYLSNFPLLLFARLKGIKVVWWGHHKTATSTGLSVAIRLAITRILSDVILCYTQTGVSYLIRHGFDERRVFATGNTINQEPIKEAMASYDGHDPFGGVPGILCCSVLRPKVRLDILIRAMKDVRLMNICLAVIGDGPLKDEYVRLADSMGVLPRIKWIGMTHDQKVMAPWFMSAKAFVYPGSIGLSILHAFSYGLPAIVHGNPDHQMPEFEIMEDGRTGLCFKEDNVDDLADKISYILTHDRERTKMSAYAMKVSHGKYSIENMVNNFTSAIDMAASLK